MFLLVGIIAWINNNTLIQQGVATQAIVADQWRVPDKGEDDYWIRYRFQDHQERSYQRQTRIDSRLWRQLDEGDAISVHYLPESPDFNRLQAELDQQWMALLFSGLGAGFGGIGWVLVGVAVIQAHRYSTLLTRGRQVTGQVVSVETDYRVRINHRHPRYVTYRFWGWDGCEQTGRSSFLPRTLEDRWQRGDTLPVYVDPDHPDRHAVDIWQV